MKFITKDVTNKETLDILYNHSALTIEGLAEDSIPDFVEWLVLNGAVKKETDNLTMYIIKGEIMNDIYELTENNRYPDDLCIVSVFNIDLMAIALKRFEIDGRWFDDIVDNNQMREQH